MPFVIYQSGVAELANKLYVTGGCVGPFNNHPVSHVDCYDPDTNSWSQIANMNIARAGHGLVNLNGRLYAIGGYGYRYWVDSVEVYDPFNNTWPLLQLKLDGKVAFNGAGLVKNCFVNDGKARSLQMC